MRLVSNSFEETQKIGEDFSKNLKNGDVVLLIGDLGAGKTEFVKGICKGLKTIEHVASPTFTIVSEYLSGSLKVYHFDFYRIENENELNEIGFDSYFDNDGIFLIEWGNKFPKFLPTNYKEVNFSHGNNINERIIFIK